MEINAKHGKKDADAKLYYPDPFTPALGVK